MKKLLYPSDPWLLPTILSTLIFVLPSLLTDLSNGYDTRLFVPELVILSRLLCYYILPAMILYSWQRIVGIDSIFFWLLIAYLIAAVSFYMTRFAWMSLIVGLMLSMSWYYARQTLKQLKLFALVVPIVAIVVFGAVVSFLPSIQIWLMSTNSDAKDADLSPKLITNESNIYVVVFDELSNRVLNEELASNSVKYPNFARLKQIAIEPPLATTNYDLTDYAVPALLSGRLQSLDWSPAERWVRVGLFDLFHPEKLFIFGSGPYQPYCEYVRVKHPTAVCWDHAKALRQLSWRPYLSAELNILLSRFVVALPSALIMEVLDAFPLFGGLLEPSIEAALHAFRVTVATPWGLPYISSESVRLSEFIKVAGLQTGALYYYHSHLPHSPYYLTDFPKPVVEIKYSDFILARSAKDVAILQMRYNTSLKMADQALGEILRVREERDKSSILIVTSDHGVARSFPDGLSRNARFIHPDVVEIPFFMVLPDTHPFKKKPIGNYQHVDFLPTLLDVLGAPVTYGFDGRSIFHGQPTPFSFTSNGLTFSQYPPPNAADTKPNVQAVAN